MENNRSRLLDNFTKKFTKNKGITLIALVVTIIVLLILAGISISMLTGQNGILTRASEAKESTGKAQTQEQEDLKTTEDNMDRILGIDKSEYGELKKGGKYVEENKTVKDMNGDTVVIPKGFKVAEDSGATVIEGIVIEDDDILNGRGNQYVWVPVTKDTNGDPTTPYAGKGTLSNGAEIKLSKYAFDQNGKEESKEIVESLLEGAWTPFWRTKDDTGPIDDYKLSVTTNGGYYIARYEASYGTNGKAGSRVSIGNSETTDDLEKGVLWNHISQTDAITACENLYVNTNSYLVNSYAWDTAIVYIQKCSVNTKYSREVTKNTVLKNTGTNSDEVCKINDMSGNLGEWTTEVCLWRISPSNMADGVVNRGGRFSKSDYYTAFRGEYSMTYIVLESDTSESVGFRAILYI